MISLIIVGVLMVLCILMIIGSFLYQKYKNKSNKGDKQNDK